MLSILLPLYIYPSRGSWNPLLTMAATHSNIGFTVIVNPASGPGPETLPDENYIAALRSLDHFPNVNLLGYVRCSYGDRDVTEIDDDIATYGDWEAEFASLGDGGLGVTLQGIFLDEFPAEAEYLPLMTHISQQIQDTWADTMGNNPTVVYNPGAVVDTSFYPLADYIVAFEDAEMERPAFMKDGLAQVDVDHRRKTSVIVHTYDGSSDDLEQLVGDVIDSGLESLFVTHQVGGQYDEWPGMWESLVGILSEREAAS